MVLSEATRITICLPLFLAGFSVWIFSRILKNSPLKQKCRLFEAFQTEPWICKQYLCWIYERFTSKIKKGQPIRVAHSIFDVYDSVGECRDAKPCVSTYRQSIHSFNDCNTLCADAVFSSDADHVHASVELGHVDDMAIAFHLKVIDHLAED